MFRVLQLISESINDDISTVDPVRDEIMSAEFIKTRKSPWIWSMYIQNIEAARSEIEIDIYF